MGTRNITTVKVNKRNRVVQYGQWDGYPTGQGVTIANFLKNLKLKDFKKKVLELEKYTNEEIEEIWTKAGATPGSNSVSINIANKVEESNPELSRNTGADILNLIQSGSVKKVSLDRGQLKKSWIEFLYEINLDLKRVRVSLNGGRSFVKSIPFSKFTSNFMPTLEKQLSELKYGRDEE